MSRHFDILSSTAAHAGTLSQAAPERATPRAAAEAKAPLARANNEISRLVQRVFLSPADVSRKAVVFCAVDQGAGCSWVCAKAAELLAEQISGRACLVDANLRSPSLHEYFGCEIGPGLLDAMRQTRPIDDFIRPTWNDKLCLLPSGAVRGDLNSTLNLAELHERFSELRAAFDFLLIDVPPISCFCDAVILGQCSDGIVLVIASNSTRRQPARMAKQNCEDAKVPILGAVLNKRTYPMPDAVYRRL